MVYLIHPILNMLRTCTNAHITQNGISRYSWKLKDAMDNTSLWFRVSRHLNNNLSQDSILAGFCILQFSCRMYNSIQRP